MPATVTFPVTFDPTAPTFSSALDDLRPELAAIPEAQLLPVRLDIQSAVQTVLGAAPEARLHKPALAAIFGEADAALVDRLEVVAHAAARAHGAHLALTSGVDLEPLAAEVIDARTRLFLDAQSLVSRKLLDPKRLAGLRGGQAYKDRCDDLLLLVSLFRELWPSIASSTIVQPADLAAAERAASKLASAMGVRDQSGAGSAPASQLRERAYTLMVRTYDQVRRMVTYLRTQEGDADEITPSLWAGRSARKHESDTLPVAPTPSTTTNVIPPGLPGADPFAQGT